MTVVAAAELSRLSYTLLLYFPPSVTQENLMTSYNDVMIICFIILAGKPLCMHGRTTIVCLHSCWCPCQIYWKLWRFQTLLSLFHTLFHACDTLPQVFWCALIPWTNLLSDSNIGTIKQINYKNTIKTIKIRWAYAQRSYQYKNICAVTIIQHSTKATQVGGLSRYCPLLPNQHGAQTIF